MKEITIDCAAIHNRVEFHAAFASALSFPDWYGNNLDALHDCLTEIGEKTGVRLLHWKELEIALGNYAMGAKKNLLHAASANPHLTILFE